MAACDPNTVPLLFISISKLSNETLEPQHYRRPISSFKILYCACKGSTCSNASAWRKDGPAAQLPTRCSSIFILPGRSVGPWLNAIAPRGESGCQDKLGQGKWIGCQLRPHPVGKLAHRARAMEKVFLKEVSRFGSDKQVNVWDCVSLHSHGNGFHGAMPTSLLATASFRRRQQPTKRPLQGLPEARLQIRSPG